MNIPFAILKLGFNAKQMEIHHMCANDFDEKLEGSIQEK